MRAYINIASNDRHIQHASKTCTKGKGKGAHEVGTMQQEPEQEVSKEEEEEYAIGGMDLGGEIYVVSAPAQECAGGIGKDEGGHDWFSR